MDGIFAYKSKPSKSGTRRYCYTNFNTHEYGYGKTPITGVDYMESKSVYSDIERWRRYEEMFASFKVLKPTWKKL